MAFSMVLRSGRLPKRSELASVLLGIVHMRPAEEKVEGSDPVLYNIPSLVATHGLRNEGFRLRRNVQSGTDLRG